MRRVLALGAALLMVAVAVVVRSWLDDRGSTTGGRDRADPVTVDDGLHVVCITELADPCLALASAVDEIRVTVADAGATADLLRSGPADDVDAWITLDHWAEIVRDGRARAGETAVLGPSTGVAATSPVVLVAWDDRAAALESSCTKGVGLACVGNRAGRPWTDAGGDVRWGDVKPGHPPADTSATGLAVVAQAVADYFDSGDYATNDFGEAGFRPWFQQLERSVPDFTPISGTPLDQMLVTGRGSYDVVGALEADAVPSVQRSRHRDAITVVYPQPLASAKVVGVGIRGADDQIASLVADDRFADALAEAGWRVPDRPLGAGLPADVPDTAGPGFPAPGVLEALRSLWIETR